MSSFDVLNCLFLLGVQNEIQLLSRLFCNSWLVCILRFLLTNAPLVKVIGNPISDGIVFKNELTHLPLLDIIKCRHPQMHFIFNDQRTPPVWDVCSSRDLLLTRYIFNN